MAPVGIRDRGQDLLPLPTAAFPRQAAGLGGGEGTGGGGGIAVDE